MRGIPSAQVTSAYVLGSIPACAGEPHRGRMTPLFLEQGSIPACAGEPSSHRPRRGWARVYPRVCGGTIGRLIGRSARRGLSPRVRGNPVLFVSRLGPGPGLSPRVRGNLIPDPDRRDGGGSIPACAGEHAWLDGSAHTEWVYPRVCGGTGRPRPSLGVVTAPGLSPRVRGNP